MNETIPLFSILIGLVSTEDSGRILEVIEALRHQTGFYDYEIIIADRRHNEISDIIRQQYPEATLLHCPMNMSIPLLRLTALDKAVGEYIIVIEDHNIPSENWLNSFYQTFQQTATEVVAIGGCIENGVTDTALDWATFLCEYSFFLEPIHEGISDNIPGMNVCYRQSVLKQLDRNLLTNGFWETTVHPILLKKGFKFYSTNKIKLKHSKKFSFSLFVKQRYIYSRYYAGMRFKRNILLHNVVACGCSLFLPPILLYRIFKQLKKKQCLFAEFISAFPVLCVFTIVWALGEMHGYLFGSGDTLSRIE